MKISRKLLAVKRKIGPVPKIYVSSEKLNGLRIGSRR